MLSRTERQSRVVYLLMILLPLIGSVFYNQGWKLPWLRGCPLWRYAGIPCPAWGLTRSFVAMAKGDWQQAVAYHLFGPILFVMFLLVAGHLLVELVRNRRLHSFYMPLMQNPRLQILTFLVVLGYHSTRLYAWGRSGELYASFASSPLKQWLNGLY